ncbi:MAG: hypothetical protein IJS53_04345 [Clostridia bacterium]|nr:hypothetical protein [Clostridia bacterium]
MKKLLLALALLLLLCPAALAEDHGDLIHCELFYGAGMENSDTRWTMDLFESYECTLVVYHREGDDERTEVIPVSWRAMEDAQAYLEGFAPETWAELPLSEHIPLDAPISSVTLIYEDGAIFTLSDNRELPEGSGPLFWTLRMFLNSYTLEKEPETVSFTFHSFDGGGPEWTPVLSAPEAVRWTSSVRYKKADHAELNGAGYDITYTFYGRVPGTVTLWFSEFGDGESPEGASSEVYTLEVDRDYNVRRIESAEEAATK